MKGKKKSSVDLVSVDVW